MTHTRSSGLAPGGGSWLYVRAVNDIDIDSDASTDDTVRSIADSQYCSAAIAASTPAVPGSPKIYCASRTLASITFAWRPVNGATGYTMTAGTVEGAYEYFLGLSSISPELTGALNTLGDPVTYTLNNLPAQKRIFIYAHSTNTTGTSKRGGAATCYTLPAPPAPVSTTCSTTTKYCVTRGVYDALVRAARKAITSPTGVQCTQDQLDKSGRSQITQNMLVSIMLAIPESELLTKDLNSNYTNRALAPMTLSRGDNMNSLSRGGDSNNIQLYSHMTLSGYKRAHWNPGVGLWQLDNFTLRAAQVDALTYGHAERADVDKGGYEVAKYIRYQYCEGYSTFGRWVACNNGSCQTRHNGTLNDTPIGRYDAVADSIQVKIVEGLTDPTRGTQQRLCRWGSTGMKMECYLYDLSLKEGYVKIDCCQSGGGGVNPYTPEAAPFISFTDNTTYTGKKTKYAVWPKSWPSSSAGLAWPATTAAGTGEAAKTIIRAVRTTEEARFSPYNDDNIPDRKGIAHHGLTKPSTETVAQYEASIEAEIARLNGGPLTVNNSSDNYGLDSGDHGPEGWFDSLVNGRDLQIYNCPGTIDDTLVEACWASTNAAAGSGSY